VTETKLILDQPDKVTHQGTVEHVVVDAPKALNEAAPTVKKPQEDVLITEDPMDGVDILLG
jgi:hypothetical protein